MLTAIILPLLILFLIAIAFFVIASNSNKPIEDYSSPIKLPSVPHKVIIPYTPDKPLPKIKTRKAKRIVLSTNHPLPVVSMHNNVTVQKSKPSLSVVHNTTPNHQISIYEDNSSDILAGVLLADALLSDNSNDNCPSHDTNSFEGFGGGSTGGGGASDSYNTSSNDTYSSSDSSDYSSSDSSSCDSSSSSD